MNWGVNSVKEVVELVALLVGALSILFGVISYRQLNRQFNFEVMVSCIERFQRIFPELDSDDLTRRSKALQQYIDLCNEELFYFKNKYVPSEVVKEWLDGMMYILPLYDDRGELMSAGKYPEIHEKGMMKNNPRLEKALCLPRKYDLDNPSGRMEAIEEIRKNLTKLTYPCA